MRSLARGRAHTFQAYISISLDATGLFRFLAFWVASKGGSSGRVLYAYFYLFFLFCGVLVGNVSPPLAPPLFPLPARCCCCCGWLLAGYIIDRTSLGPRYPLRDGVPRVLHARCGVSRAPELLLPSLRCTGDD